MCVANGNDIHAQAKARRHGRQGERDKERERERETRTKSTASEPQPTQQTLSSFALELLALSILIHAFRIVMNIWVYGPDTDSIGTFSAFHLVSAAEA